MLRLRKRINTRTPSALRNLLLIDENNKGDVYIRLKSGTQVGIAPNHIAVTQDRISIHPSPKSEFYTTIKHTLELENGFKKTSVALTDAVKRKNGFTLILSHRFSDLDAPAYDCKNDGAEILELQTFDPKEFSLVLGIFVGSRDSTFPTSSSKALVHSFFSENFQIIICSTWINLPALPCSWTFTIRTFDPEIFDNDSGRESAYLKMAGKSGSACLELFHNLVNELIVNLLKTYQTMTEDNEFKKTIQESINLVPRIASIQL